MKFIKSVLVALCTLSVIPCNAQLASAIGASDNATTNEESITNNSEEDSFSHGFKKASSVSINYIGRFKSAAALNMDFRFSYLNIGAGYAVSGGDAWNIYAGAAHRYYFTQDLFIDGAVGAIFSRSTSETKEVVGQKKHTTLGKVWYSDIYETKKNSYNAFGVYLLPRIGWLIGGGFGINVGYMMVAPKFKFDKFFDGGDVMLGIVYSN